MDGKFKLFVDFPDFPDQVPPGLLPDKKKEERRFVFKDAFIKHLCKYLRNKNMEVPTEEMSFNKWFAYFEGLSCLPTLENLLKEKASTSIP
jgi:hypothetical protein